MVLAIFDLDNTLIGGDSDHLWGEFLCKYNHVDASAYQEHNDRFFQDYQRGELDIDAYLRFALEPLKNRDPEQLREWHHAFMQEYIQPIWLSQAEALLEKHRQQGHELLIITATNRFITEPIARKLGIRHLIASEPEMLNGRYTGNISGTPCYRDGKVERLDLWLEETDHSLKDAWFYSDSHNDLPLLEQVDNPVAVDPDEELAQTAGSRGWSIISLR